VESYEATPRQIIEVSKQTLANIFHRINRLILVGSGIRTSYPSGSSIETARDSHLLLSTENMRILCIMDGSCSWLLAGGSTHGFPPIRLMHLELPVDLPSAASTPKKVGNDPCLFENLHRVSDTNDMLDHPVNLLERTS